MHLNLFQRSDPTACSSGFQWYTCNSNGFRGCCHVDPCDLKGCPDANSASSSTSATVTTISTITVSPGKQPQTIVTVTLVPLSTPLSSVTSTIKSTPTAPTLVVGAIASVTSSSTPAATQSSEPPASSNSTTPIIAGAVSGVVAVAILSILVWFCLRKRKQRNDRRKSIAQYGLPTKDYVLDRSIAPDQLPQHRGVFDDYGGRYISPRPAPAIPAHISRTTSGDSIKIDALDAIDAPLPSDPEKAALTPPPVHEHPAYHQLPGESPEIPTYHPGRPIHSTSMNMTQHPTYHISQLSYHPAFPSGPSTPPTHSIAAIPHRTTEVKRQKSSPRSGYRSGPQDVKPVVPKMPPSHTRSHTLPSAPSELEADVPDSYISPTISQNCYSLNPPNPNIRVSTQTHYNPQDYAAYAPRGSSQSKGPIGLGVNSLYSPQQPNNITSPASTIASPNSPFHLDTQYRLSTSQSPPSSLHKISELREGKEKEVVVREKEIVSPMSPERERWSGATATEGVEMVEVRSPVSASVETPGSAFGTWESWARR